MAVEHTNLNNRAGNTRRQTQGRIANVRGLFTEDGAQKLFFRRHRAFTLWCNLATQNIAGMHFSTDIDDTCFIQVLQRFFAHVRNIAGDFFRTKLGVAGHDVELFDMDRGEHVIANHAFGQQDGILEVVAVPGHERDEHVLTKRQVAQIGRRTISDDVASLHPVTDANQRTLVDAGVLVRPLELVQRIDINAGLGWIGFLRRANNDTLGIHLIHNT